MFRWEKAYAKKALTQGNKSFSYNKHQVISMLQKLCFTDICFMDNINFILPEFCSALIKKRTFQVHFS